MNKKLCILTGVGPETGTGAEIARYFSENGYHVAMIARTEDNLKNLEKKYNNTTAYPCDVGNIKDFKQTINKMAVTKVSGKALFKNSLKPFLKSFSFNSLANLNEWRTECKKQK